MDIPMDDSTRTPSPSTSPETPTQPQPTQTQTPQFDPRFASNSLFYFHHIIDPPNATLTAQVLGPNLSVTFTHTRAATSYPRVQSQKMLLKKTTGFLALITPPSSGSSSSGDARTVLAWAESGHGLGPDGDVLDTQPYILANALWAKRVIKLSKMMRINMGHPFDRLTRGGMEGIFRASHVEVKLAVHAVYTLLRVFKITRSGAGVKRRDFKKLRTRKWGDGSTPRFEIYFSKKNCHACATFVRKLEELTGVQIKMFWKPRLVEIQYDAVKMGEASPAAAVAAGVTDGDAIMVEDDIDENEEEEEEGGENEEIREIAMVDLTEGMEDAARTGRFMTPQPLGAFMDGLAYCVGQGPSSRTTTAIVGLARISQRQNAIQRHLGGRSRARRLRTPPPQEACQTWLATPPSSRRRETQAQRGGGESPTQRASARRRTSESDTRARARMRSLL
ncbi:hypothetical protein QQS21_005371 [Conoideocrella luteorostrata]|uniref:Uncharacterized protein n=1 Tax=Conoideocrella luteorostrata TaxID=1105319 RepID=A0AAJ0FZ33_9HYPO|nr:hypothetical protein QQS21_005371 [Conoideocrella luteorostrata]